MNQASENENVVEDSPEPSVPVEAEAVADSDEQPMTLGAAIYDFVMQSYCWLMIFFILYVLSIGPVYSSWRKAVDLGEKPLLQAIYLPLAGLCSESETVNAVVEWYVGFWQS